MARTQADLQAVLRTLAPKAWLKRPPDNKMSYPCFIYKPAKPLHLRGNDRVYLRFPCWSVTYITQDPNSNIVERMLDTFEYCELDRAEYESDGLYHYPFTLYY